MKTNYDPNNGEQIEGKSIHDVMAAARVRFGGNYLVMNTQTYNDPHWKAVYNMAKGDGVCLHMNEERMRREVYQWAEKL